MSDYPFGSRHPIDMMVAVRGQLFVVAALTREVETCSENLFKDQNSVEAAVLITETNEKMAALFEEIERALDFLREAEDERAAA